MHVSTKILHNFTIKILNLSGNLQDGILGGGQANLGKNHYSLYLPSIMYNNRDFILISYMSLIQLFLYFH